MTQKRLWGDDSQGSPGPEPRQDSNQARCGEPGSPRDKRLTSGSVEISVGIGQGFGLPESAQVADDATDDPVHDGSVLEAAHGPCSAVDLWKRPLYGVGGALLALRRLRALEEVEQSIQFKPQAYDCSGLTVPPLPGPLAEPHHRLSRGAGSAPP